jgi:competence protein ComEA
VEWLRETIELVRKRDQAALKRVIYFVVVAVIALAVIFSSLGPAETGKAQTSETTITVATQYVAISGQVVMPGVYPVDSTTRLFEVVSAAGGFTKKADQSSVNLARLVQDGEQIIVLAKGGSNPDQTSQLMSLNAATSDELETLPGVGPTLAGRIVDWRVANGGFKSVEDLLKVGGIGDKLFAGIRSMVQP